MGDTALLSKYSRLMLVAALCVTSTCLALSAASDARAATKHVRLSWQEFSKDPSAVAALRRAITEMKRRNTAPKDSAEYRKSWEYWAAIHGYFGATPTTTVEAVRASRSPLYSGFYNGLSNSTPPASPPGLAASIWATCQHSPRGASTPYFFPWHRMYLFFFERVLRDAAQDPALTLPYWDYTNPDQLSAPEEFVSAELAPNLPNPLYDERRTANLDLLGLQGEVTDIDSLLDEGKFDVFQLNSEQGIHAAIHCIVGNRCQAPNIGIVPASANDPLFWLHHANIDRVWECWTTRYGRDANPTNNADWMGKEFSFVDEHGDPAKMNVRELFDPAGRIDYVYDNTSQCNRKPLTVATESVILASTSKETVSLGTSEGIVVDGLSKDVKLEGGAGASVLETLGESGGAGPIARATLRIQGLDAAAQPPALFNIFIKAQRTGKRSHVGTLSFFGFAGDVQHEDHDQNGEKRALVYDITSALRELDLTSADAGDVTVEFEATTGLQGDAVPQGVAAELKQTPLRIEQLSIEVERSKTELAPQ